LETWDTNFQSVHSPFILSNYTFPLLALLESVILTFGYNFSCPKHNDLCYSAYVCTYVHIHTYVYVFVYVCMCMCICHV